jgi:iron complex transport system ATP-binding protein
VIATSALPPAVRLRGVSVRFGARAALHRVDFTARAGEFVALAGPNGSGKTTMLKVLLGFVTPSEGEAELFGARVADLPVRERARRMAWVPQDESARDDVPILDYVLYGRYAHLGPLEGESQEDRRIALRVLDEVGLADRADDGILSISGGERQRAILARALAQEAPLLLLDEPTSHLDIGHQIDLLERVQRLSRGRGVTVIAALHDLNLAGRYADRIFVLSRGHVDANGAPPEVLSEELLSRVWGVVADLRKDPRTGAPYLLPHHVVGSPSSARPSAAWGPVHVVGGGGVASPYLRALVDHGYRATAGALNLLDSDSETAEILGVPTALEIPFSPLGPEVRARNRELLNAARAIVVAPFAVAPSNLSNLEDLVPFAGKTPIWVVPRAVTPRWDFTNGVAARLLDSLERAGARRIDSPEALIAALAPVAALDAPRSEASATATPG